jgi:hypothetical protein
MISNAFSIITIDHMINHGGNIQKILSDSQAVKLNQNYEVDLKHVTWYDPVKSYIVQKFYDILGVPILNLFPGSFRQ